MPVIDIELRSRCEGERVPVSETFTADGSQEDDWPTTQRFSRRSGEYLHDAAYAAAIERPSESTGLSRSVVIVMVGLILVVAAVVLWRGA